MARRSAAPVVRLLAVALVVPLLCARCAPKAPRSYAPAAPEETRRALAAWDQAVARADSLGPARLLYEARMIQGLFSLPGTLSVQQAPGVVEATLAGPFGNPVARYADGALAGEGIRPLRAEPEDLRSLLAGIWRKGGPEVAGFRDGNALLRWGSAEAVEAVLDVATARLRSLTVVRQDGSIAAVYSGRFDPWPERVELEDGRSGNKLRLVLIGQERIPELGPSPGR